MPFVGVCQARGKAGGLLRNTVSPTFLLTKSLWVVCRLADK